MASLQIADFGDLLKATLAELNEPNYTDLTVDEVDFPAAKALMTNQRKVSAGKSVDWKARIQTSDSARNIAVTEHDSVNSNDGLIEMSVPWRKSMTAYHFYDEELLVNRSPRRLVDIIKMKEADAMTDWIQLLESNFWAFPSASDTVTPYGLPYWCTKNATVGFNGGIPSGYSTVAGQSPTTYPRWNNYSGNYVAVTADDFIQKMRTMGTATGFKPPVARPSTSTGTKRRYFTNLSVQQQMESLADSRNDNLGRDLNSGEVMFRRAAIEYAPRLDSDTTNPMYQIDTGVFKIVSLANAWMKRRVLAPYSGQRNVTAVFLDSNYQIVCFNRRCLGVLATGTSYPS